MYTSKSGLFANMCLSSGVNTTTMLQLTGLCVFILQVMKIHLNNAGLNPIEHSNNAVFLRYLNLSVVERKDRKDWAIFMSAVNID